MTTLINGFPGAEFFDMASDHVGDTFRIFVSEPRMLEPGKQYPVIYILDGNLSFGLGMQTLGALSLGGEVPQAYVVGVGYPTEGGFMSVVAKRSRDYTPTPGAELERAATSASELGGAPRFLQFLLEELKPLIESRYRVDPGDATLSGSSLGGLFGAWTLLTRPDAFSRYILSSPSIWWDNESVWDWERRCADANTDINASVFIAAGELETAEQQRLAALQMVQSNTALKPMVETSIAMYDQYGWPKMAEITPLLAERMAARAYAGLSIHCHNMPDETHMSVMPAAYSRGLRYVFGNWRPA